MPWTLEDHTDNTKTLQIKADSLVREYTGGWAGVPMFVEGRNHPVVFYGNNAEYSTFTLSFTTYSETEYEMAYTLVMQKRRLTLTTESFVFDLRVVGKVSIEQVKAGPTPTEVAGGRQVRHMFKWSVPVMEVNS